MKTKEAKATAKMVEKFIAEHGYEMEVSLNTLTKGSLYVVISSKDTDGLYIPNRLMNFLVSVAVCGLYFTKNDVTGKTEVWI